MESSLMERNVEYRTLSPLQFDSIFFSLKMFKLLTKRFATESVASKSNKLVLNLTLPYQVMLVLTL